MASYSVAAGEHGAYSKTLAASTVDTVTFADDVLSVQVVSNGTAAVYATVNGAAPTAGAAATYELPAGGVSVLRIPVPTSGGTVVKLISAGTPTYSVVDGDASTLELGGPSSTAAVLVERATVTSAPATQVASSASSVTLFSSNSAARLRTIFNDSTAALYVKYGTTASSSSFNVKIAAGGYFEFPSPLYTGRVDGIWAAANGNAYVTEG